MRRSARGRPWHAYLLDIINKRILRLNLNHAAEEICDVE